MQGERELRGEIERRRREREIYNRRSIYRGTEKMLRQMQITRERNLEIMKQRNVGREMNEEAETESEI